MAAPDFPGSPTVGQTYTPTSGLTYRWDGQVWSTTGAPQNAYWTDTGTALTPTDATKKVTIPGPTATGADMSNLIVGSRTIKARVWEFPTADIGMLSINRYWDGAAWLRDDTAKSGWAVQMDAASDSVAFNRTAAAGGATSALILDGNGRLTFGDSTASKGRLTVWGPGRVALSSNRTFAGPSDDASLPQWNLDFGSDNFIIYRAPAASSALANMLDVYNTGDLRIYGSSGMKASGTAWSNPSDPRLKTDVASYSAGLDQICLLNPITYRLKSAPDILCYGLDASAVQEVFPECVSKVNMKLPGEEEETKDVLTLDIHPILIAVINAIKELRDELRGTTPNP